MDNNVKKHLSIEKQKIGTWGHLVKSRIDITLEYAGKRVLDVGCSSGAYVRFLRERGYKAYGLDLLPEEKWQGEYESCFQVGDICCLPYKDDSFDTIIAFEVLEHIENINLALKELHRVCKNNIIISVPNCFQPKVFQASGLAYHHWIDRTHKQFFNKNLLKNMLNKKGFSMQKIKYINPIIPEILVLSSWHIPTKLTYFIGQLANKFPFKKKYYMTLLVAAYKNKKGSK